MTAITLRGPYHFADEGILFPNLQWALKNSRFEEGRPLYGLQHFDPTWFAQAMLAIAAPEYPILDVAVIPGDRAEGGSLPLQIEVEEFHCDWRSSTRLRRVSLTGRLRKDHAGRTWLVNRRQVQQYDVHILVATERKVGLLQFVPRGRTRRPFPPTCEGFQLATQLPLDLN